MYQTVGLPNIGNSCYFNAFIQICKPLLFEILTINKLQLFEESTKNTNTNILINSLNDFYNNYFTYKENGRNFIHEYKQLYLIINKIRHFQIGSQQDSSEAILLVTDLIKDYTYLKSLVTIGFNQVIQCNNCFSYKMCDIQEESMLISNTLLTKNTTVSFKEFLNNSLIPCNYIPTESDDFKCKCDSNNQKSYNIKTVFTSLPKYLFINVGRYDNHQRKIMKMVEIENLFKISIPVNLNDVLLKKNNDKIQYHYDLIGVTIHNGMSLDSGHYTAYSKCGDQWFYCNDNSVSKCDITEKKNDICLNCTVLLYIKIN